MVRKQRNMKNEKDTLLNLKYEKNLKNMQNEKHTL